MRVERRRAEPIPRRRRTGRTWVGIAVLAACTALGLLAVGNAGTAAGPRGVMPSAAGLRGRFAAVQMRSGLPELGLALDFEGHAQLISPAFRLVHPEEPTCVRAQTTVDGDSEAVSVCPSAAAGLLQTGTQPVFELEAEDGGGPVLGAARSRLAPAGSDAAAVAGYLAGLAHLGLPVPGYELLRLTVNGSDWGLYTIEELWVGEPEGPAASPIGSWVIEFQPPVGDASPLRELGSSFAGAEVELLWIAGLDLSGSSTDPAATTELQAAITTEATARFQQLLREGRGAGERIDAERMGQYMALTALWRGSLLPDWRVTSFVYDAKSATFLPLAGGLPHDAAVPIPLQLYDSPQIGRAYARALRVYGAPLYLDDVLDTELEALATVLTESGGSDLRDNLARNQSRMRDVIAPESTLRAWYTEDGDALGIALEPTVPFPVEILGLAFGEQGVLPFEPGWITGPAGVAMIGDTGNVILPARLADLPDVVRVVVPKVAVPAVAANEDITLDVVTRLWGLEESIPVRVVRESLIGSNDG